MTIHNSPLLSVGWVAEYLGLSRQRVLGMINEGKLEADRIDEPNGRVFYGIWESSLPASKVDLP